MSHMEIQTLLDQFRELSSDERGKGHMFERLIANYLHTDPQYEDLLSDIWLWEEWPNRWSADVGIDLVAREKATGDYWAIQCKFFDPSHTIQKADIDSFLSASGKHFATNDGSHQFARRFVVSTTDRWNRNAESAIEGQTIPVSRIGLSDLAESPIDWTKFSITNPADIRLRARKTPRPHQEEAIAAVLDGFKAHERGKMVMACGTGKTFTSLRLTERTVPENGCVLFLAPSISLVAQTLREWTAEAEPSIHAFVVCSDTKVGRDEEDMRTHDLAYPATTDSRKLARAVQAVSSDRRTVIFSTYQSIQVVADAQKAGLDDFDLIICDEAHRTTGLTLPNEDPSDFVKVHQNHIIRAEKRLYMTATPRIYADASKNKADENDAVLYSMDDEDTFGPEFYRLGFGKAVERDLLSEYKVLIVAVEQDKMGAVVNSYNKAYKLDDKKAIDINFATKIIGSWKGLSKQGLVMVDEDGQQEAVTEDTDPMRRAVAFSRSIKASQQMTDIFGSLARLYAGEYHDEDAPLMVDCHLQHVDGTMNALKRTAALDWLKDDPGQGKCRILSNARCLSEGIDVPALDSVVFFDTRESIVDIVQSVGRVMRKADGKKYGYIILPVCMPSKNVPDYNSYIEGDPQFRGIWKVIKALRAHDESLVDEAEFRRKIKVITGEEKSGDQQDRDGDTLPLDFPALPIDAINEAVYAAIPKKLGDREYWSEWAKSVAGIADRLVARIKELLKGQDARAAFDQFLAGLQDNLNPAVLEDEAIDMLAQHIITRPVFEALFEGYSFTRNNPVSKAMQQVIEVMDDHEVGSETDDLEKFYKHVTDRVSYAKSDKSRQEIIRNLYDTFFGNAFPRMAERLGIVYTPVEVVDFIIHSADVALKKHFGTGLSDRDVQILDPFTGTGTFMVRLLQSGLIRPEDLKHQYVNELHANEIVLLAYYIAAINIESSYHAMTGEYHPFDGIVLTDTFQMNETRDLVDTAVLPENSERVNRQKQQPIRVVIGNPPYSAKQDDSNDNNQNLVYPTLDAGIRNTYAAKSTATNVNNLYDPYIRAIRLASNRIEERGVVAFVTNGSFIDGNAADGLRKSLMDEFSQLYIFNLRGNQRTSGEESRREGGKIFGSGSRTPVAISIMVKDPAHHGPCELFYHDIGDYLSREEKLAIVEDFASIKGMKWKRIQPNEEGDWINQRDPAFDNFIEIGDKKSGNEAIFGVYSRGVATSRDAWAYNFSRNELVSNMTSMIDAYNREVAVWKTALDGRTKRTVDKIVDHDPKNNSWSRGLKKDAERLVPHAFDKNSVVSSVYRPFTRQWMYFNKSFNDMTYQMPKLYPKSGTHNISICLTGKGGSKPFSALVTDATTDLQMHANGQCFPLYWYEKADTSNSAAPTLALGGPSGTPDEHGYIRRDAITDWALNKFRTHYADQSITKEDLFWYVYGILHSPEYSDRFADNLKRMLPRIPLAGDFWAFSRAGRQLGEWHLGYEAVAPYPIEEETKRLVMEPDDYRVHKMAFGKKGKEKDKSVIIYNQHLILRGIPLEAYDYIVRPEKLSTY